MSALQKAAMRVMEARDETVLPKARDGMMQERMEELRAALAEQPAEQEPVAWMVDVDLANYQGQSEYRTILSWKAKPVWTGTHEINEVLKAVPLYTFPPASKPLTDAEIGQVRWQCRWNRMSTDDNVVYATTQQLDAFARAIERAHGIGDHE